MKGLTRLAIITLAMNASTAIFADDASNALAFFRDKGTGERMAAAEIALKSKDYNKALAIYTPLANAGLVIAQYQLGYMYQNGFGVDKADTLATAWYLKASSQGMADANYAL